MALAKIIQNLNLTTNYIGAIKACMHNKMHEITHNLWVRNVGHEKLYLFGLWVINGGKINVNFQMSANHVTMFVATPLWAKCEDETHTPKSGNLESFGTLKNSKLDCMGQNTSHWGVLFTVGNFLKCRCPKWPCMSHLDIYSLSYGCPKSQESNPWQFRDSSLGVPGKNAIRM